MVAGVRERDAAAFEVLFRRYYAGLCAVATRYARSAESGEEVVQDVLLGVWRQGAAWAPTRGARAYLYGAVVNRALNSRRHERYVTGHAARPGQARESVSADAALYEDELATALRSAVAQLPERRRLVFELSRDHGMTYAEIAEALGLSQKTVDQQMGRALKALRAALVAYAALSLVFFTGT